MKYTVEMNKKILGSFDELANAEIFAKAYTEATGNEVQVVDNSKPEKAEQKPVMENPVIYMIHYGAEALREKLNELSLEELQAVIKAYHITSTRSKDAQKLRDLIWNRSEVRATQGCTFQSFADQPTEAAKEPTPVVEAQAIDTVAFVTENGIEALEARLEGMDSTELKAIIKQNQLDPLHQFGGVKKAERLREIILAVTRQRATKGDGFI